VSGADDYLAKPFAFEVLAARIDRVLRRGARIAELKRSNAALDARIAARAIDIGEMRGALAISDAERQRLSAMIAQMAGSTAAEAPRKRASPTAGTSAAS
jgi:DNA-binding response OmpR family regulator